MAFYRVFIHGRNFLVDVSDLPMVTGTQLPPKLPAKHGFYTNCFIEAASPEEAWEQAAARLRAKPALRKLVKNEEWDRPSLSLEQIDEIVTLDEGISADQALVLVRGSR